MPMTENGFRKLTYAEILEAQITRAKDLFGNDMDTSEKSVLGKYIRLNTSDFAEQEAALEAVYLARYIDTATGISLDRLTPFANIRRNGATQAMLSVSPRKYQHNGCDYSHEYQTGDSIRHAVSHRPKHQHASWRNQYNYNRMRHRRNDWE